MEDQILRVQRSYLQIQRYRHMKGGNSVRPEEFREHSKDRRIFYKIDCELQIQI